MRYSIQYIQLWRIPSFNINSSRAHAQKCPRFFSMKVDITQRKDEGNQNIIQMMQKQYAIVLLQVCSIFAKYSLLGFSTIKVFYTSSIHPFTLTRSVITAAMQETR